MSGERECYVGPKRTFFGEFGYMDSSCIRKRIVNTGRGYKNRFLASTLKFS